MLDPTTTFDVWVKDGEAVKAGPHLGTVRGDIRVLLSGERTALNYLQRMSGIATYTHEMAELLKLVAVKITVTIYQTVFC